MEFDPNQLVLGRGEVYFDVFTLGTKVGIGERYIGNTPSFQVSRSIDRLDRSTSFKGQKVAKEGAVIAENNSVEFITDSISIENVGLFYGQEGSTIAIPAGNQITENFVVQRGRFYQLGKTAYPNGVRQVLDVIVVFNGNIVPIDGNYSLDEANGRIQVMNGSTVIPNGGMLYVTFAWRRTFSDSLSSKAREVYGALRFVSRAVVGPRRNVYFPYVRISAKGAIDFKGDQWQQIPFTATAMRLGPAVEQVYFDTLLETGQSSDEQAIIDQGGITLGQFPELEDELNTIINISMPASDYGQAIP